MTYQLSEDGQVLRDPEGRPVLIEHNGKLAPVLDLEPLDAPLYHKKYKPKKESKNA